MTPKKYGFEIVQSRVKGVSSLKFKTREEAKRFQRRVGGRVAKAPFKVLKARRLYFRKKNGEYAYL